MPVYITDPDAFEKVMQVEGEGMDEREKELFKEEHGSGHMCSFAAFEYEFAKISTDKRKEFPRNAVTVQGNAAIYGSGGWNRYFVRYTGEIEFSRVHSTPQAQALARKIGFSIS